MRVHARAVERDLAVPAVRKLERLLALDNRRLGHELLELREALGAPRPEVVRVLERFLQSLPARVGRIAVAERGAQRPA